MGILSEINNEINGAFTIHDDIVFFEYTHQELEKNTADIFIIIGQTSIKCSEMIRTQSCDILPLEVTFGFTLYAKPQVEYNDILDCIDSKILSPLVESSYNLKKLNIPQPIFEAKYQRNIVKAEITLQANYKSTGGV
jgi:hypothetical protein